MKANELMIGDWVYDTLSQTDIKVNRGCFEINPLNGICYAENLILIPLTAEMLEKNGFKKFNFRGSAWQHEWTWRNNTLTNVSLWCREPNDNTKDGWMIRIESPTSSLCVKVEFLHQLQHALRLCGIEKEIEL